MRRSTSGRTAGAAVKLPVPAASLTNARGGAPVASPCPTRMSGLPSPSTSPMASAVTSLMPPLGIAPASSVNPPVPARYRRKVEPAPSTRS
jgi:hypothetical protein